MEENRPWYKRVWVIMGLFFAALTVIGLAFFARQTFYYYTGLKQGKSFEDLMSVKRATVVQQPAEDSTRESRRRVKALVAGRSGEPYDGKASSTHEIVQFSDFGCPYCKAAESTVRSLARTRPDIRVSFRDYPVTELHSYAELAAQAARCVWLQGQPNIYWRYREVVYSDQTRLDSLALRYAATQAGVDLNDYDLCVRSGETAKGVRQSMVDAEAAGVRGTPTYFVDGKMLEGEAPLEELMKALE